jgi:photosystem II stability/assembly factor-like uncharacterized protein
MKKAFYILPAIGLLVCGATVFQILHSEPNEFILEKGKKKKNYQEKARLAMGASEHRQSKIADENGEFKPEYYLNALKQANAKLTLSNPSARNQSLVWEELGPDNIGGRTRAILVDRRDPTGNTVWAGGVAGGVWKSTDGGANWNYDFKIKANSVEFLPVSCIAQIGDGTIYVGTGEGLAQVGPSANSAGGNAKNSGSAGNGIYRLKNGETEWESLQSTTLSTLTSTFNKTEDFAVVNRIAADPSPNSQLWSNAHLVVATQGGLYETVDGGDSWQLIQPTGLSAAQAKQPCADVKWSSDPNFVIASVTGSSSPPEAGRRVVRSIDGGASWEVLSNTNNPGFPSLRGRIELATAPSDADVAYMLIAESGTNFGATHGLYQTTDRGATWKVVATKSVNFDPFGDQNQGWYDNVLAVSPADAYKVYMGGVDFYTYGSGTGVKLADVGLGGQISNPFYIHPDKHAIAFDPFNPEVMYLGCDGGIYKTTKALSSFPYPEFRIRNKNFNVTQFYSVAAARTGEVMGGTQDNGTILVNFLGNTKMAGEDVRGGDGIYTEISHLNPNAYFGGVYYGAIGRSQNGGKRGTFGSPFDIKIDPGNAGQPSFCGGSNCCQFITPFYLHETTKAFDSPDSVDFTADKYYGSGSTVYVKSTTGFLLQAVTLAAGQELQAGQKLSEVTGTKYHDYVKARFFVSCLNSIWMTNDILDFTNAPKWFNLATVTGYTQSFAASSDGNRLYAGTASGRVVKVDSLNTAQYTYSTGSLPVTPTKIKVTTYTVANNRAIDGIAVDQNDPDHVVAVVSGYSNTNQPHVYQSFNGGVTWTAIQGDLPNFPVYDVVIDANNSSNYVIATEFGIWASFDQGFTWHEQTSVADPNLKMPRVPVYRLRQLPLYEDQCGVIYAGTHGRGMWRTTALTPAGCNTTPGIVSNVKNLENTKEGGITGLIVYPNPANANSKVKLELEANAEVDVRVIDMPGRVLRTRSYKDVPKGDSDVEFDFSGLPAGNYLMTATVNKKRTYSRLFTVAK